MDEARGEEATQCGQQQQCILSGEVYLRHRLEKSSFSPEIPKKNTFPLKYIYIINTRENYTTRGLLPARNLLISFLEEEPQTGKEEHTRGVPVRACRRAGVQEAIKSYDM